MAGRTLARRSSHPAPPGRAVVASSAQYTGAEAPKIYGMDKGWQAECYRFYTLIPEVRSAVQYYANSLAKCEMFIASPTIDETAGTVSWKPTYTGPEALFLDDMFSGKANQTEMLHDIGVHLTIGGECFVIGYHADRANPPINSTPGDGALIWGVYAPVAVVTQGSNWALKFEGHNDMVLNEHDVVIRIWRPDPYMREHADSPLKSSLSVLHEIEDADLHIQAQLHSRLTSAGIFWVPEGLDFPDPPPVEGATEAEKKQAETANGPTKLMKLLAGVAAKAMKDRGSPAAKIPIIIQVPDDMIEHVGKITHFWSELDEKAMAIRSGALHRFAIGMDLPPEMIEGMSSNGGTGGGTSNGVSHWGAWQIEESAIKIHIEPAMELVCCALTVDYIRIQVPGTQKVVQFSTVRLRLRPDRSKEALELYDRGVLGPAALVRETGFKPEDLMTDAERGVWLTILVAKGSNTPEQVAAAAASLGVALPAPTEPAQIETTEAPQPPTLEDHPTNPRDPEERLAAGLVIACNALVLNALARAGNRLLNLKAGRVTPPDGVPVYSIHTFAIGEPDVDRLLADAFPMANEMLDGLADPADVMPTLQRYTATLVAGKAEHSRTELVKWLDRIEEHA